MIPKILFSSSLSEVRKEWSHLPFRAPHYSGSVSGHRVEFALAAGGVLYLDEPESLSAEVVEQLSILIEGSGDHVSPAPRAIVLNCPENVPQESDAERLRRARKVYEVAEVFSFARVRAVANSRPKIPDWILRLNAANPQE